MILGELRPHGVPSLNEVRDILRPPPDLDAEIRRFLADQLGGVLPPDPVRGMDWYYDWVVLGERSLEAFRVFRGALPEGSDGPVVDIGSGLGTFVLLANRFGLAAVGVEPGDERELARRRAAAVLGPGEHDGLLRAGVGEALELVDGSAAGVLLHDVLEHVGDWRAVLAEARRVLAPGGVLYVKGPSYAVRFIEPHYRLPWLPLLPRPLARRYLRLARRDAGYFEHLGYRRRGEVLAQLRGLGFALEFPRHAKLRDPDSVNRGWARAAAGQLNRHPALLALGERLAESPLQSTIDVVARAPAGR